MHVAHEPIAEGGINAKGQQKVIDKQTGGTRWIDVKKPRVMSPQGIPVNPPKA